MGMRAPTKQGVWCEPTSKADCQSRGGNKDRFCPGVQLKCFPPVLHEVLHHSLVKDCAIKWLFYKPKKLNIGNYPRSPSKLSNAGLRKQVKVSLLICRRGVLSWHELTASGCLTIPNGGVHACLSRRTARRHCGSPLRWATARW